MMSASRHLKSQLGVSLIEVMVAVVIVAVGLLGIAKLQVASLKNNQAAVQQSGAVMAVYSILDRMRANRIDLGGYELSNWASSGPAGGSLAANDLDEWFDELRGNLNAQPPIMPMVGPSAQARIQCNASRYCQIEIRWNERVDGQGNVATQSIEIEAQL
ncbi:type IV pilus assembly protein PilV [Marinobacterium sp. MBR-111]|jgi:type IV pilus assembly protein PilV|uniref:type IV pilus modification protein PilV n=1 Tax=Marinobacterium TaxID=48075 RepID=UPI001A8ED841|nr:type IV pilus modification protein PilV [Marinobacterium iners]